MDETTLFVSICCDNQAPLAKARVKMFHGKNMHLCLRPNFEIFFLFSFNKDFNFYLLMEKLFQSQRRVLQIFELI